jgi:hypothetical protein
MLSGDRFRVFASDAETVCFDKLPGENLWEIVHHKSLPAITRHADDLLVLLP